MKRKEALFILITTFIAIVAWIIFSILDSAVSSTISEVLNIQISAISPSFNTKVIDMLKKRNQTESLNAEGILTENQASDAAQLSPTTPPTPTSLPLPTPLQASNSATIQNIITP